MAVMPCDLFSLQLISNSLVKQVVTFLLLINYLNLTIRPDVILYKKKIMEIISLRIPLIPSLDIRFKTFNELSLHKKKKKKKKKKNLKKKSNLTQKPL